MLNLLIAQFSKSYEDITKSARKTVTPDRAKILVDQHSTRWIRLCCVRTSNLYMFTLLHSLVYKISMQLFTVNYLIVLSILNRGFSDLINKMKK